MCVLRKRIITSVFLKPVNPIVMNVKLKDTICTTLKCTSVRFLGDVESYGEIFGYKS